MGNLVWIKNVFSKVPLIGSLPETLYRHHTEAVQELFISLAISISPIYIGAFVLHVDKISVSYFDCVYKIIQNGELFMYSAATLSPVMFIVTREREAVRSFPSKFTFIGAVIICALVSTAIFTFMRLKPQVLPKQIIEISLIIYAAAIAVFYLALVYNNTYLPDPAHQIRKEEGDYIERYRRHRR